MVLRADDAAIVQAAGVLNAGGLVAFPTETVYGLGASAFLPAALARVFEVKKRPVFDPLIVHIAALGDLEEVAVPAALPPAARQMAQDLCRALWPGPLTLILPRNPRVPALVSAGLDTVAVRFPACEVAQKLILAGPRAVAAPSANPFGYLSPTCAAHVAEHFADTIDVILDGGTTRLGLESTVLTLCTPEPRVLRWGGTPRRAIERITGPLAEADGGGGGAYHSPGEYASPGQLPSHYAPGTPLIPHLPEEMAALEFSPADAYLFFSEASKRAFARRAGLAADAAGLFALSGRGGARQAAARLFLVLHALDKKNFRAIHAELAPPAGLGEAINDRLRRAGA
jgi:L-threonylcarbamoyladenylate synthase